MPRRFLLSLHHCSFSALTLRNCSPRPALDSATIAEIPRIVAEQMHSQHIPAPCQIGGLRMASELIRPHVVGFFDQMLKSREVL